MNEEEHAGANCSEVLVGKWRRREVDEEGFSRPDFNSAMTRESGLIAPGRMFGGIAEGRAVSGKPGRVCPHRGAEAKAPLISYGVMMTPG